jgi:hypothetical protein
MKYFLFILLLNSLLFAATSTDLSNRIVIDGYSDDFTLDEKIIQDTITNCYVPLESDNDSKWGIYNDVRQIDVTWDKNFLYVAVDACSWSNNVILFIDIYNDYGISNMLQLNTWKRAFKFYNSNPDFFLATWDTNTAPQFWKLQQGSNTTADQISIEAYATFNTGKLDRSMEAKIPWNILYPENDNQRTMQNYPLIKFIALITSGSDYKSGPDVAPDNLEGMPNDANKTVIIDNYVCVNVDENGDGLPDMNSGPFKKTSYFKKPPFKPVSLEVTKIVFPHGKIFSPYKETITFNMETNRVSPFNVEIFNTEGKYIAKAEPITNEELSWMWNGRNKYGKIVPVGVYILRFISDSGEISEKRAIVVIK